MTSLVLLPGLMCDERLFGPQISYFSDKMEVSVGDITGHDKISDIASELLKRTPPKFTLAGLSMGGIVAMEVYRLEPQRIERIALMDTNYLDESENVQKMRDFQIASVKAGKLEEIMRENLIPKYIDDSTENSKIIDLCLEMALNLGEEVFERQSRALQFRPNQTETLKKIKIPCLILCGENDRMCPIERHKQMYELIPNSQLSVITNSGHLTTLEQPMEVCFALENLMSGKFD